jgi:hypothetical protein
MGAGWVAGSVRARLLLQRRAGSDVAASVAEAGSLARAVELLTRAGQLPAASGPSLEEAQRALAATLALRVRLLAAWVPRDAAGGLRALASWFELVNLEDRLAWLGGAELRSPFELGMLSTAWAQAGEARDADELRQALARSSWGDPGSNAPDDVHLALRLAWARRVSAQVPVLRPWAAGAVAILLAGELFVAGRVADDDLVRRVGLGSSRWREAGSVSELRELLPAAASWALAGVDDPAELWRAELGWWGRVRGEAERMTRSRLDRDGVVHGSVALLAFDAMLLSTALAVAASGGTPEAREVLDALV